MVEPYIEYSRWSPCLRCGLEHRMCRCPEGWVPDPDNPMSPILVKVPMPLTDGVGPFDSGRWAYRNGAVNGRGKVR